MYEPRRAQGEWEQIAPRNKGQGKVTDPGASRRFSWEVRKFQGGAERIGEKKRGVSVVVMRISIRASSV